MRRATFLLTIIVLFIAGCQNQQKKLFVVTDNPETVLVPNDSNTFYFPGDFNDFGNKWYSKYLFYLKEPVLFKDTSSDEIYRFTWLRTFHHPICIRFVKQNNTYTLYWKESNGAGGYEPGVIIINKKMNVDRKTWETFSEKIKESNFWNLPTDDDDLLGLDGSQWILEGRSTNQYHVVDRWTPNNASSYYHCCDFLINLTDLIINEKEKY